MGTLDSHRPTRCIALIGLRGSGKTTVGRELAAILGGRCVDTDDLIVQGAGQSIAALFAEEGEVGFRRREREVIEQVAADPPAVISVGGGAILADENVRALKRVATVVWLAAPPEVLWRRIASDDATGGTRPPLTASSGLEEVVRLSAERSSRYERAADLVVDTSTETPRGIAHRIAEQLSGRASPHPGRM